MGRPPSRSRPGRAGGTAHNEFGGELDVQGVNPVAVQEPDEEADGHPAHFGQGLADGGEQRAGGLSHIDVVEAGDGQVLGHPQATLCGRGQRTDSDLVVEAGQRGGPLGQVEQFAGSAVAEGCGRLAGADQLGRVQDAGLRERRGMTGQAGGPASQLCGPAITPIRRWPSRAR